MPTQQEWADHLRDQAHEAEHEDEMGRPLPLSELVALVGDANIQLQPLAACVQSATLHKDGVTSITFGTLCQSPAGVLNDTGPVGFVVWMNREAVARVREEYDRGR